MSTCAKLFSKRRPRCESEGLRTLALSGTSLMRQLQQARQHKGYANIRFRVAKRKSTSESRSICSSKERPRSRPELVLSQTLDLPFRPTFMAQSIPHPHQEPCLSSYIHGLIAHLFKTWATLLPDLSSENRNMSYPLAQDACPEISPTKEGKWR